MTEIGPRVVLFDGVCNVCNGAVNFIIDHDPEGRFQFASLQSPIGRELAARHGIGGELSTMVFIDGDTAHTKSTAALRIAAQLTGAVRHLAWLRVVPRPLRDFAYRVFANNRYRWFGQAETCRVPTPDIRRRFLAEPSA